MSDEYSQPTLELSRTFEGWWLPRRPLCCDDEGVWNDEGNRQRLLDMLKAHAAELRAWASDAGVRLPSAESAGELREQVRDLPQEPQIQEQPGYGYQPGFQQPQQWQQQPWN